MFYGTLNGRGHAYRISIFWTGKFEFRLTSKISAGERATTTKFHAVKEDHFLHGLLKFSSAMVRRSAARGPKRKTFTPKFLENGLADRRHFPAFDRARRADENPGILISYLLGLGGGVPPNFTPRISKTVWKTPQFYFADRITGLFDFYRWKTIWEF